MRRVRVGLLGIATWPVILLASFCILGCQNTRFIATPDTSMQLPSHVAGATDAAMMKLQRDLNKKGITVITAGQDYLVSIPSPALFPEQSPRLIWESYAILNEVVDFLKQFRKVGVNVTGYSSKYISQRREHALTLARARAVGDYLWSQGIDSRFIFTEGAGSNKPVTIYSPANDSSPNSRIEITFRDAIV